MQRFHRKNEIHIHARAIKYELYNFSDSKYQLNALPFALKTGTAHYKDEW